MEKRFNKFICRICSTIVDQTSEMWSLFEVTVEQKTLAAIIDHCFGIEIANNGTMITKVCTNCKSDIEGAYRLVTRLRMSDSQLIELIPKIETMNPGNQGISSVFISEEEIKTEPIVEILAKDESEDYPAADYLTDIEYDEVHVDINGDMVEEEYQAKTEDGDDQAETSRRNNYCKRSPEQTRTSTLEDSKHSEERVAHKWSTVNFDSSCSSGDDSCATDYEHLNMSTDDEDADGRPKRKRLYYGVKSDSQPKRCCSCKEPLDSHEKVQDHSDMYHQAARITNPKEYGDKIFECSVCFKRFETKKLYLQHQRKMYVDVLHPCPRCEEEFANLYVLKKHIKIDHKKKFIITELEEMRSKSNICCGCKKAFPTSDALREHVEKIHFPERVLWETSNTFECNVCYNRFKTYKSLRHHQLRFFKEKKFVCTLCGKAFREKVRLAEHENFHRKIRKFQCSLCPAKFAIKNSYDVHVKMHDAEECFNCEYCGKGFRKKSLLITHLQTHSADRPFKCQLCPNTFTRQNLLDSHLLGHSGSKPYKCQQCPASYIHQRDLRRHVREKHEGIRSFKCNLCPKAYIRQKLLLAHLKSHED